MLNTHRYQSCSHPPDICTVCSGHTSQGTGKSSLPASVSQPHRAVLGQGTPPTRARELILRLQQKRFDPAIADAISNVDFKPELEFGTGGDGFTTSFALTHYATHSARPGHLQTRLGQRQSALAAPQESTPRLMAVRVVSTVMRGDSLLQVPHHAP